MIIFDLACCQDHRFEGWFQSAPAYDEQLESGMISCPHCASTEIRRLPSAVHLAKGGHTPEPVRERKETASAGGEKDILVAYRQLMTAIFANSEDVGRDFADEARKIHFMEAPQRSIRGEASVDDYEMLREDGIEVLLLPTIKKESFEH